MAFSGCGCAEGVDAPGWGAAVDVVEVVVVTPGLGEVVGLGGGALCLGLVASAGFAEGVFDPLRFRCCNRYWVTSSTLARASANLEASRHFRASASLSCCAFFSAAVR